MYLFEGIATYHQQLLQQETSCEKVVRFYLDQITQKIALKAFVEVYAEEALLKAKLLDTNRISGTPLK